LRLQRKLLLEGVSDAVAHERDVAFALVADRQGIGVKASTT
jgi:hypothetical protein